MEVLKNCENKWEIVERIVEIIISRVMEIRNVNEFEWKRGEIEVVRVC